MSHVVKIAQVQQSNHNTVGLSYDQLKRLQSEIASGSKTGNAQDMFNISSALAVAVKNGQTVSRAVVDNKMMTLGMQKRVEMVQGEPHACYVKNENGREVVSSEVSIVLGENKLPASIHDELDKSNIKVSEMRTMVMQACRLIASYAHVEKDHWKPNLTATTCPFNSVLVPAMYNLNLFNNLSITGSYSGPTLYKLLTELADGEFGEAILKAASGLSFLGERVVKTDSLNANRLTFSLHGDRTPVMVSSLDVRTVKTVESIGMGQRILASRIALASQQKLGGTNFLEVNSDYIDGVRLYAPLTKYRELLRCLVNADISKYIVTGKIAFEVSDAEFARGMVKIFEEISKACKKDIELHIIGINGFSVKNTTIGIVSMMERDYQIHYDFSIISDPLAEPAIEKGIMEDRVLYDAISKSLSIYDRRSDPVMLLCPMARIDNVVQFVTFDPFSARFLTLYFPKQCLKLREMFRDSNEKEKIVEIIKEDGKDDIVVMKEEEEIVTTKWVDESDYFKLRTYGVHALAGYPSCHRPFKFLIPNQLKYLWAMNDCVYFDNRLFMFNDVKGSLTVLSPSFGRMDVVHLSDEDYKKLPLMSTVHRDAVTQYPPPPSRSEIVPTNDPVPDANFAFISSMKDDDVIALNADDLS